MAIPFISMSSAISGYFIAVRQIFKSSTAQFFEQLIKILFTLFLLNIFIKNNRFSPYFALILGDTISEVFAFCINFILYNIDVKRYKTNYKNSCPDKLYTLKIFKIAFPIAITALIKSGISTIKQILIPISFEKKSFNCSQALSIYGEINGMALPVILFPYLITSSIGNLLIPEFSAFYATGKFTKMKKISIFTLLIFIIFSITTSIVMFLLSDFLSEFIYQNQNISFYIKVLSPYLVLAITDNIIDNILKGINKQNEVMIINILDLFLNTIFIYFSIPILGISGYIISIYLSEIFNIIFSFSVLYKSLSQK